MTGNFMIDGDDGSNPASPKFEDLPECPECNGVGTLYISCCGNDMSDIINETDICPTCFEHCGTEGESCYMCDGTGEISWDDHKDYYSNE